MKNLFDIKELPKQGEEIETVFHYNNIEIKRILSSDQLHQATFCQSEAEWVMLLEGEAKIFMNGRISVLNKGEYLFIPPMCEHTIVDVKEGTVWLAIHIYDKGRK